MDASTRPTFDSLFESLNGWGLYQKRLYFILTFLFEIFATQNVVFMMFGGAAPSWTCLNSTVEDNFFTNTTTNDLQTKNNSCQIYTNCKNIQYDEDLHSVATEFRLYCNNEYASDLITTIQMVGISVGGLIWGQLAETFGRKRILLIIYLLLFSSGLIAAFSVNWIMFVISFFFVGIGLGGSLTVEFILVQEFISADKRLFVAVMNGWPFGVMIFCFFSWYLRNWRYILLVTNFTPLPCLLLFLWVYESPRWLLQHGRIEEAHDVLCKIAVLNKRPKPTISDLKCLLDKNSKTEKKYSYHHLFSRTILIRYTFALSFSFLVVSMVSYGLIFNVKNLPGNRYLNAFIMACLGAVTQWSILLLNKRAGRRVIHQCSLLIGGIACLIVTILETLGNDSNYVYFISLFAGLGNAALNPTWNIVSLFSVELFPTVVRNLAGGLCSVAARIGGVFAPMFIYSCSSWKPLPFLVFGLLALVNCLVSFLAFPETKGKPLVDAFPLPKNKSFKLKGTKYANDDNNSLAI